jgi:hypothetical protein
MTNRPHYIPKESRAATATADELLPLPKLGESVSEWRDRLPTRHAFLAAMRDLEHGLACEDHERDRQLAAHCSVVAVTLAAHALRIDQPHMSPVGMLCVLIDSIGTAIGRCPAVLAQQLAETIPHFVRVHHRREHCGRTDTTGH